MRCPLHRPPRACSAVRLHGETGLPLCPPPEHRSLWSWPVHHLPVPSLDLTFVLGTSLPCPLRHSPVVPSPRLSRRLRSPGRPAEHILSSGTGGDGGSGGPGPRAPHAEARRGAADSRCSDVSLVFATWRVHVAQRENVVSPYALEMGCKACPVLDTPKPLLT